MNPKHSEHDAIHEAHVIALTPTRGEHDVTEPDPYCWGDDPCVCVQLKAARQDERKLFTDALRKKIMGLPYEIDGEIWVDRDEVLDWIDALRNQE